MGSPSRSQVKKAGSTIRAYTRGERTVEQYEAALDVVARYRASVSYPLVKVNNGVRGFLATLNLDAEVSQRLKRMDTIVDKLSGRESGLSLERMGDLGGCRVVLEDNNLDDLERLREWIKYRWGDQLYRERDYVSEPRSSGYRAIHLVVERDERLIEIQLRTQRMHAWAQLMEALGASMGQNFKQDRGDSAAQAFGRALSKAHQAQDGLYRLTPEDVADLKARRDALRAMLNGTEQ